MRGLDISKRDAKVCVRVAGAERRKTVETVTTWDSMTSQILALRDHLVAERITFASVDADIARHRRADRGASGPPFRWKTILDTRVLIAEDLGAAPTPLVLAQVECYTRRSAASRHPSRWRGAATSM